ncbi:MAG: hypothetical protein JXM79_12035 [Sedimentisphaerales bacterium]|nr:hypothetical protein [Sedimentisphaerales bacterium]
MSRSRRKTSERIAVSQPDKPKTAGSLSRGSRARLSQDVLFFASFYCYLWLYIDLRLIYHGAGVITNFPVFNKGWSFFLPFLSYPGGPVEYLSAFLSELFYYSWAGALVVSIQSWLISLCIDEMLKATNTLRIRGIRFVLPILLLVLYTQYTYYFVTTMALLTALVTACLYMKLTSSPASTFKSISVFLILSITTYYLAAGGFFLFAVVCAMYELFFKLRWKISLLCLLSFAVVPYVLGLMIFRVSIVDAFSKFLPFSWEMTKYNARTRVIEIVYILYLLPPFVLLLTGLWQIIRKRRYSVRKPDGKKSGKKHRNLPSRIFSWYDGSVKLKYVTGLLLLLAIAGGAVFFSRNETLRTRFKVDYYAYHKMWPELLTSARQTPNHPFVAHAVNRALYHVGRLGYDMFTWPQNPDHLLLSDPKYKWMYWQIFDVFLDLGVVNMAENALTECLEGLGSRPMILQRLALVNMIKGNTDSAKIYLGALSKTLFHAKWANQYLDRLRTDPTLSSDPYIQHLRSIRLDRDCPIYSLLKEKTLLWLLEKNPQNRMAFEYLMAWYLLNRYLTKFIEKIELMPGLGYAKLPTHYEEAALIYAFKSRKPVALTDYSPNPQVRRRIEDFSRILQAHGGNRQAAYNDLSKNFCNTYFFYNIYAPKKTSQ